MTQDQILDGALKWLRGVKPWRMNGERMRLVRQRAHRQITGGFENSPIEYYMRPGRGIRWGRRYVDGLQNNPQGFFGSVLPSVDPMRWWR